MLDVDIVRRHAQFSPNDLRERCLVPLSLRLHADTRDRLAGRVHANFAAIEHLDTRDIEMLAGTSADDLSEGGMPMPISSPRARFSDLLASQSLVVHVLHRQSESPFIVAAVIRPVESRTIGERFRFDEILKT